MFCENWEQANAAVQWHYFNYSNSISPVLSEETSHEEKKDSNVPEVSPKPSISAESGKQAINSESNICGESPRDLFDTSVGITSDRVVDDSFKPTEGNIIDYGHRTQSQSGSHPKTRELSHNATVPVEIQDYEHGKTVVNYNHMNLKEGTEHKKSNTAAAEQPGDVEQRNRRPSPAKPHTISPKSDKRADRRDFSSGSGTRQNRSSDRSRSPSVRKYREKQRSRSGSRHSYSRRKRSRSRSRSWSRRSDGSYRGRRRSRSRSRSKRITASSGRSSSRSPSYRRRSRSRSTGRRRRRSRSRSRQRFRSRSRSQSYRSRSRSWSPRRYSRSRSHEQRRRSRSCGRRSRSGDRRRGYSRSRSRSPPIVPLRREKYGKATNCDATTVIKQEPVNRPVVGVGANVSNPILIDPNPPIQYDAHGGAVVYSQLQAPNTQNQVKKLLISCGFFFSILVEHQLLRTLH